MIAWARGRPRGVLGLVIAAVCLLVLVAANLPPTGCDDEGCTTGVLVQHEDLPYAPPAVEALRLCAGGRCVSTARQLGAGSTLVPLAPGRARPVMLTAALLSASGTVITRHVDTLDLRRDTPAGEHCAVCYFASARIGVDGRIRKPGRPAGGPAPNEGPKLDVISAGRVLAARSRPAGGSRFPVRPDLPIEMRTEAPVTLRARVVSSGRAADRLQPLEDRRRWLVHVQDIERADRLIVTTRRLSDGRRARFEVPVLRLRGCRPHRPRCGP